MGSYHKPSIVTIGTEAQRLANLVRESKDHSGPRLMIPDAMCRLLTALVGHDDNLAAAAAPDLLEALQAVNAYGCSIARCDPAHVENREHHENCPMAQVEEALAKALPPKETRG